MFQNGLKKKLIKIQEKKSLFIREVTGKQEKKASLLIYWISIELLNIFKNK